MSSQNNEFEIPFNLSRRGKKEEINTKSIGRRIGSLAASRLANKPNLGGKRRGGRGLGVPDGDLNPRTRIDVDGDGMIFDGWPGWEQPDPTPSSPINTPRLSLSSGEKEKKPSFPRKPTYGPFIGSAEEKFGKAKTWEEFKEIYDDTEINFFDYETTGLVFDEFREPSSNGQPVQFGVVKMKGDKEIARLNLFMNPKEPLGDWSAKYLKDKDGKQLTDEWLSGQMSMAEAHQALVEFAGEDSIFGVQNAAFDKDVLEQTLSDAGIEWRPGGYLDTKDIADMTLPKWSEENQDGPFITDSEGNKKPSNGLAAITKYLEVELGEKHHTADADAQATGLVMSAIINGALERDWPTNLLDSEKRKKKLQKDNEKFDAEIKKFRAEKEQFIKDAKKTEQPSLSSGSQERPVIKLDNSKKRPVISFKKDEREMLKKHRSTNYKYGDDSVLGGKINAYKNDWLKGLSSQQIADLIVPDSQDGHFRMWVDDIAPGAYEVEGPRAAFRKYYDEMMANSPWDEVDYSPGNVQASRDAVKALLDSSPAVKWAFENHGAPSIGVMSAKGIEVYEAIPSVNEKLARLQNERGLAQKPFVRARLSPGTNLLIFNKRALIDREGSMPGEETPLLWSDAHMPLITDAHIDKSISGTIVHEWGHWLVFRAVKDTEQGKKNRTNFFGSGNINDDNYINALGLSEYYKQTEKDQALIDLWDNKVPIDESGDVPRVLTSYGHVNPAETFAEGVVAYFHPNPEVRKNAINEKLRKDIESFLGDGSESRPWDDNESVEIALASGRTQNQRNARRTTDIGSSLQALPESSEDDREVERLDRQLSLSSGASIPDSGSRKLEIINDFDNRKNDQFATPIRVVNFKDKNGKETEYTIFATGKFGDNVYVFDKKKLDAFIERKEQELTSFYGKPLDEVGISVISRMTEEKDIRDKKNGLVGAMSVMTPSGEDSTSVVNEIAVDDRHKRRGLASALFKYHRDSWPDQDLHHSSALSDDGKAFAAATPTDGTSNPPVNNLQNDLNNFVNSLRNDFVVEPSENDNDISLSSGAKYEEIVRNQPRPSSQQSTSANNFKDLIKFDELRSADKWKVTGKDPFDDDIEEIDDSEDRANLKNSIKQAVESIFSNEIELDRNIIVESASGEKINLGNRIKITAQVTDVSSDTLSEDDILEQEQEIGEFMFGSKDGVMTAIQVKMKIAPSDESAVAKLVESGIPESMIDLDNPKSGIELGNAKRQILTDGDKTIVSHESLFVGKPARQYGIASAVNGRNESLYREMGIESIVTFAQSSDHFDQLGATHWARNGFTWLGEPSKQRFINVIDEAITNNPELFSDEEKLRISSLYKKKDGGKGTFIGFHYTSSAEAEDLIDFEAADDIFRNANSGGGVAIFFKREVAKPSGLEAIRNRIKRRVGSDSDDSLSPSLSSGATNRQPPVGRKPTKKNIADGQKVLDKLKEESVYYENSGYYEAGNSSGAAKAGEQILKAENRLIARNIVLQAERDYEKLKLYEQDYINAGDHYYVAEAEGAVVGANRTFEAMYGPVWTEKEYNASLKRQRDEEKKKAKRDAGEVSLSSGAFDYRGLHGAPGRGSGAPLHDLISPDYSVYPEDVYSSDAIKFYGVGDDTLDAMAFNLIRSFKGKPNAEVTVYRAVPVSPAKRLERLKKEEKYIMKYGRVPSGTSTNLGPSEYYDKIINEIAELESAPQERALVSAGDWVTPFRQYAVSHGEGALRGDYEIVRKRVKAKNVYTDGNSWLEWGYDDSKGSLSLSSGAQPKINLSDEEKREIIRLASQRTDNFSRSVVAQYNRNNGRLSNKQWAALNRMTSRGAMGLSSGAMVQDVDILERVARTFDGKSLPDEPSTPIDQRLISKMISGLNKKDGTPVSVNDFLGFLTRIADINDDRLGNHPGFNDWEEKILPIESLAGIFKELGHSRIDVPGSKTKKILGPVVNELTDLVGDEEFVQTAREYVLPPLEVWAKAAAKSILQMQEFTKDVGEPRREFMRREFRIEELDGVNSFVLRDINDEIIMSAPIANMSSRDRSGFQYSNINSIMFGYHQQTPGVPFMTMVKRHLYPNDPLAEVLADRKVMSANNDAAMGGRNMAESLEGATLTPLDVYKFSDSPAGQRVKEMFEQAYTGVAHYDEFARRYAVRVRKLVSDAGLDPDSPEVKRALTTGWTQVVDTTEEPPENGGRFISAALLVRNLVAGLYRPSWDSAGESYTTPHEFMHMITGQGFTRHGEMASNIGWLGAFGKDVWPAVANLLTAQTRFFDMQKEDLEGGDLIEGNKTFRGLVLSEIKELLGGDGDDFGRTSQSLLDELYQGGGILRTEKSDGLFEGFGWIDPLFPLEAEDLGWGYKQNREDTADGLSLSSGGKSSRIVITREGYNQRLDRTGGFANQDEGKDKDVEELKQEHIKRFGYSYTRIDKDGYDKNPKAIIEIFDDELAYNSLVDLTITIGKGRDGQTKTINTIRKILEQIEESAKAKDMEFELGNGPDGFKHYLKKLDMSYIEEENNERLRLIEKYKSEGLTAVEAITRAYADMKNDERFSYGKRFLKNTEDENE
jgi:DNA polymerase III epsilon subunit-like protein